MAPAGLAIARALAALLLFAQIALGEAAPASSRDCPACLADFALYDPDYEDDGVWEEEVSALQSMFTAYGWSHRKLGPRELNRAELGIGDARSYRALIAPGGWSWYREEALTPAGEEGIRGFVRSGGHYVGFCAGAYWAAKRIIWADQASGPRMAYSRPEDYSGRYDYKLALFPGDAKGPLGWMPWRSGTNVNLSLAKINLDNPTMKRIGLPAETRFLYGGGPFFTGSADIEGLEVWARAKMIPGGTAPKRPDPEIGENQPTIIRYPSGRGSVTLFSYHPDVLIQHPADGIELTQFFREGDIDWVTGSQTMAEINLHSWNIVHAALQLASNQEATPLRELP